MWKCMLFWGAALCALALFFRRPPRPPLAGVAAAAADFEPLPAPGEDRTCCPVCGWNPCTEDCRLGLSCYDLENLEAQFDPPWGPELEEAA